MSEKGPASTVGNFSVVVDGHKSLGFIKSFEGANKLSEDMKMVGGPLATPMLYQGNLKYDDAKLTLAFGQSRGFMDWINLTFKNEPVSKTGVAHACNAKFESVSVQEMMGMWISELKFAKLDANSKEHFSADATFKVESVAFKKGTGEVVSGEIGKAAINWSCANFSVEVGGLDCSMVMECELPGFTQKFAELRRGQSRAIEWAPGNLEFGAFTLTMPMRSWDSWRDAADATFVKGNMDMASQMTGAVTFLDTSLKKELGRMELGGISIKKLGLDKAESNSEKIKKFKAEMVVNTMTFIPTMIE